MAHLTLTLSLTLTLTRRSSAPQLPSEPHGHHNGHPATSTPIHPASPASGGLAVEGGHAGRGVISCGGHGSGSGAPLGCDASGVAGYPPSRGVDGYPPSRQVAIALVDYVSQNKEELSFQRGDTIRDISTDAAAPEASSQVDTWLRGELRGRTGLIPVQSRAARP